MAHSPSTALLLRAMSSTLAILVASLPAALMAQETPTFLPPISVTAAPVGASLLLDEPSTGGSRLNLTPKETPASVEVITGETIRERGHITVNEAASRATGFTSTGNPGNGGTGLSVRGFEGHGSVMQLYDGTQIYVGNGTVSFPFDTWTADRIEILRGPASVLYGAGAIGGALNVVPKKPNRNAFENEALVEFGSDMTKTLAAGSGGPLSNKLSYRADIVGRHSDGWVDRGESESVAFSLALRADVSDTFAITLRNDYGYQQPMKYFGTPLVNGRLDESLREKNYNADNTIIEYRDNWSQLKLDWQASNSLKLSNTSYFLTTDRHWRNVESYSFNAATGLIDRSDYLEILHDQEQYGNRTEASLENSLFGRRNQTSVGVDVNLVHYDRRNNSPFGGSSSVNPYSFNPGLFDSPDPTTKEFNAETLQYSTFAENRLFLTDRWTLVGGLRFDHIDLERENLRNTQTVDKTFTDVTWRAGTVFNLTKDTALYGQYATAVDPVGGIVSLAPANSRFTLATGEVVEVGVKQSFMQGRGEWTFAGYNIVKKDILSRDPNNPSVTQQIGEQSSRGIEAAIGFDLTRTLRLEANAALLNAEFKAFTEAGGVSRAGNRPPNVPEQVGNLWLTWAFAPEWKARGAARYVGETFSDNANTLNRPDYVLFDAGVAWSPMQSLTVALQVFNILDKVYAVTSYSDQQWILGRPRTALLSTSVRF